MPLCLDALHDTLDIVLAEIVGTCFRGQAIHTNNDFLLLCSALVVVGFVCYEDHKQEVKNTSILFLFTIDLSTYQLQQIQILVRLILMAIIKAKI